MSVFKPDHYFKRVTDIEPEFLRENRIRGLVLDIDNTLAFANDPTPFEGVVDWIEKLKEAGISLLVVSNNNSKRVSPFAKLLGLEYICYAMKPLPVGFLRAVKKFGIPAGEVATVGDQLFTDIAGAKLAGMTAVLVEPARMEKALFFRIKRKLEKRLLQRYRLTERQ